MSYRIITQRDILNKFDRAYILDEPTGKIVAEVLALEGCKPLVELANRAAAEAVEAAKKRTAMRAPCAEPGPDGRFFCTGAEGHDGDHQARTSEGVLAASWPRKKENDT